MINEILDELRELKKLTWAPSFHIVKRIEQLEEKIMSKTENIKNNIENAITSKKVQKQTATIQTKTNLYTPNVGITEKIVKPDDDMTIKG